MTQKINFLKNKIKNFFLSSETFFTIILIFTASASFYLGKISEQIKLQPKSVENIQLQKDVNEQKNNQIKLVASRKGKKYHLPWCSGAITMSEKNKIYFNNKAEAEKAGYTPAKNCEGL